MSPRTLSCVKSSNDGDRGSLRFIKQPRRFMAHSILYVVISLLNWRARALTLPIVSIDYKSFIFGRSIPRLPSVRRCIRRGTNCALYATVLAVALSGTRPEAVKTNKPTYIAHTWPLLNTPFSLLKRKLVSNSPFREPTKIRVLTSPEGM
jgi:hypothetical protein